MKKRIFSIAMMVLITLSLFVPISVSAEEETKTLLAGEYIFNESITHYTAEFVSQETFDAGSIYYPLNHTVIMNGVEKNHVKIRCLYYNGTFTRSTGSSFTCEDYVVIQSHNGSVALGSKDIYTDGNYDVTNTNKQHDDVWNIDDRKIIIKEDQTVDVALYDWFINVTNYNSVNSTPEATYTIKGGTYTFNDSIDDAPLKITTQEQIDNFVNYEPMIIGDYLVTCFYVDGVFNVGDTMHDYSNYTHFSVVLNDNLVMAYDNGSSNGELYSHHWNAKEPLTIEDCYVTKDTYDWFVKVTDYNTVNAPSQGTPDYDTPDVTYTIPAGLYIFNATPTMPTEDITQDFPTYFSVMINNGLENVVYNGLRMNFTTTTIEYNLDGTLTTVYKAPPLADGGWSNDAYRQVTFLEDVTVSEDFYNLFILNTTPPPEYKPPYVFSNDGITYDGNTFATYKDENTKRVDVENTYCAMFDNGYVYIVSSTEPFRIASSGHVRPNPSINFDMWYIDNGVINYMGTNTSFNPEKWIAGNHSILNWNDDAQYHGFDVGMVFPTTPQTQLPTVVGAEMMMGVMTEMIAILPCLIALLTGYLALRKALAILRQILQTA